MSNREDTTDQRSELETLKRRLVETERALRQCEKRCRLLLEKAPWCYLALDERGFIIQVSQAFLDTLGYSRNDVVGRWFGEFLMPKDKESFGLRFPGYRDTDRIVGEELQAVAGRGATLTLNLSAWTERTDCGAFRQLHVKLCDITELKRVEDGLRQSQILLAHAEELASIGAWEFDLASRRFFLSEGWLRIYGTNNSSPLLRELIHLAPPEDGMAMWQSFQDALKGNAPYRLQHRILRGDTGEERFVEAFGEVVRDESGRPVRLLGATLDITDIKASAEALRLSEAKYRHLVENLHEGIWVLDAEDNTTFVNPAMERILGFSEEEMLGRSFRGFLVPEERERDKARLERRRRGVRESYEAEFIRKDGTKGIATIVAMPIFDEHARYSGRMASVTDVTDRKTAEKEAEESYKSFINIVENTTDGILVVDREGYVLYANGRASILLGLPRESLAGTLFSVPSPVADRREINVVGSGQTPRLAEIGVTRTTWRGAEAGLIVLRDITERTQYEEALKKSEEQMRLLIESAPVGITIALDGRYHYANPAFLKMFGYETVQDMMGLPLEGLYLPEDRDEIRNEARAVMAGADSARPLLQKHGSKQNGQAFDVVLWLKTMDYEGRQALLGFTIDAGEEQALRAQLLQSQKMEAIGTLSSGIAHDFNNILTVINGYSELLLADQQIGDQQYEDLHKIYSASLRGADLVHGLLAFSRKAESRPRPLNLNREVEQVAMLMSRTIPKMIAIATRLAPNLYTVNADPSQIEQILINLMVNARDAMPDGGKLTLGTSNVQLDEEYCRHHMGAQPGEHVQLTVRDTGVGMDREIVEHIFEPFFTTKQAGRGTGLGLAMVYGIVKQHNGHITCESEPRAGTVFSIYFPTYHVESLAGDSLLAVAVPGGNETILLVDDEEPILDVAGRILSRRGYRVLTASNGREALETYYVERETISLIILDLIMPEMGGKQCLEQILAVNPSAKVIMVSGYSSGTREIDAVRLGAKAFIRKPFRMEGLLQTVRDILDEVEV